MVGTKGNAVGRACLLVTSWCVLAQAQSDTIRWQAPAVCPDRAALLRAVSEFVEPLPQESEGFRAEGNVTVAPDGKFQLDLQVTSATGSGSRQVSSDDCETLVNVAAFGIALALNPDLAGQLPAQAGVAPRETNVAPEPRPDEAAAVEPHLDEAAALESRPDEAAATKPRQNVVVPAAPLQPTFAPADSGPPAPRKEPFVVFAGVMPVLDTSLMPKPAGGVAVDVAGRVVEGFRLGAGGEVYLPQTESLAGEGGGEFFLWSLEALACLDIPLTALAWATVALCPSFHAGVLRADGTGVTKPLTQYSAIYGPGISARGLVDVGDRLRVATTAGMVFPLDRDTFALGAGPVHEVPAWSVQLGIGLEIGVF